MHRLQCRAVGNVIVLKQNNKSKAVVWAVLRQLLFQQRKGHQQQSVFSEPHLSFCVAHEKLRLPSTAGRSFINWYFHTAATREPFSVVHSLWLSLLDCCLLLVLHTNSLGEDFHYCDTMCCGGKKRHFVHSRTRS